jgi:hypothetical protein
MELKLTLQFQEVHLQNAIGPETQWTFTGLPGGVSVGSIDRVDELNATITLVRKCFSRL